jgi:hypothetical protein
MIMVFPFGVNMYLQSAILPIHVTWMGKMAQMGRISNSGAEALTSGVEPHTLFSGLPPFDGSPTSQQFQARGSTPLGHPANLTVRDSLMSRPGAGHIRI